MAVNYRDMEYCGHTEKKQETGEKNSLRAFADSIGGHSESFFSRMTIRIRQMYQRGRLEYKMFKISSAADDAVIGFGMPARSAVNKTDNLVFSEITNDNNALIVIGSCC